MLNLLSLFIVVTLIAPSVTLAWTPTEARQLTPPERIGRLAEEAMMGQADRPDRKAVHSADLTGGDIAATVVITDTGFDPASVTVQTGEMVEWLNQTAETQRIVGGTPYRIYLPLVLRESTGAQVGAFAGVQSGGVVYRKSGEWGSGDIAPGERFTHTFTVTGEYPYFLAGVPDVTGMVIVQGAPQPDFEMSIAPTSRSVPVGESAQYTVALTATNGFTAPVTLSTSDLPAGVTETWRTNPVTPTASTLLTLTPTLDTPTGEHTFAVTGVGGGQSHDAQATLHVEGECTPITGASFTSDSPVELGQAMHFTATTSPANASVPLTYTWDVGEGPTQGNATMAHTFATTGTHAVTLTVANPCGTVTFTDTVEVVEADECIAVDNASFTSNSPVELGQTMHFTATTLPANATRPLTYTWDVGEGPTQDNATMTHTFAATGTHAVTLTVANPCGTATFTDTVEVTAAPLTPDFEIAAWPATQTITRGHSVSYTVAVTAVHGFTEAVALGSVPQQLR
jgi:PKD repeat protein